MVLPNQQITVLDPGMGQVIANPNSPLYIGKSSLGTVGQLYSFSRLNDVRGTLGFGELAEDVSKALQLRGGPVLAMPTDASTAAVTSSVVQPSGTPPAVGLSGTPRGTYTGRVEVVAGGALGTATFKYTLDAHDLTRLSATYSPIRTIPAGGSFVLGDSGLTATFASGTYVAGDVYTFTTQAARANSTNIGEAATALLAMTQIQFPLFVLSQTHQEETDASGIAAAVSGHMTSFATGFRYMRAILDIGSGDTKANVLAEAANWSSKRVSPWYGHAYSTVALPYEGYSKRKSGCYSSAAARASRELISTNLARYASGNLEDVLAIDFDGFADQTLDGVGIASLRTWPGVSGFYIANGRLKSPLGSDFTDIHFGRIMDVACRTVYEAQLPFIAEGFMTTETGAIDLLEAADVENAVNSALTDKLLRPKNARGRKGHVSAVSYSVDKEHNLNTTGQLLTTVAVRPLGYSNEILTQIGYSLNA